MADVLSKEKRSKLMSLIRSSGNQNTELKLLRVFKLYGIRGWRRNQRVVGKPDFVFRERKVAVFVDGCFWHGCRWHCRMPKSRRGFWESKISKNKNRDRVVKALLMQDGWLVIRIWEHALDDPPAVIARVHEALATPFDCR